MIPLISDEPSIWSDFNIHPTYPSNTTMDDKVPPSNLSGFEPYIGHYDYTVHLWLQIKLIAVSLHTLYPSYSCSCPFAGPQDSSSLLIAMTGYHLHTSGNTLTLCVAMCFVYAILKLIFILYRLFVITAFLGLAYLCTPLVDCNIPARPASRGRRHARSSNVSEDGQAST
jgi:hypothetical protein